MKRLITFPLISSLMMIAQPVLAAGPSISTVSFPNGVTANVATTLSVSVSSSATVTSCNLYVDSEDIGTMTLNGSSASRPYTFPRGGVFTLFVFCKDSDGGKASGPNTSILVLGEIVQTPTFGGGSSGGSSPTVPTTPTVSTTPVSTTTSPSLPVGIRPQIKAITAKAGTLIKLVCPEQVGSDHPCRAVYFRGSDGLRHAFPNAKAYFTWYENFDGITELTPEEMGAIPLGLNVTYRPGVRMVKFQTLDRVYAVTRGGALRWVTSEAVARALYGEEWNKQIDDISDGFFSNYRFGSDVTDASYQPIVEAEAATAIDV